MLDIKAADDRYAEIIYLMDTVPGLEELMVSRSGGLKPFNIRVMDVEAFVSDNRWMPVTDTAIQSPSEIDFHPDGLFSEDIFGQIGTPDRMLKFGWIDLRTHILAPIVFKNLLKISALYGEIMAGTTYAVFDPVKKDFVRVSGDPEDTPESSTGFSFFMHHFPSIDFRMTDSSSRENRIRLIEKYKDIIFYKKYVVSPASLRDIQLDQRMLVQDDINGLYRSLLYLSNAIPKGAQSPIYDSVRYRIQIKAVEIYDYLENIQSGKKGFFLGAYASRRVAMGTRNVITAADYTMTSPNDPQALKPNETMVGLYQTAKGLQPLVIHGLKVSIFDPVFGTSDATVVPLVNPETKALEYVEITHAERSLYTDQQKIEDWLTRFFNKDVRGRPITVTGKNGVPYWLCMVYDLGTRIILFRSLRDLEKRMGRKPVMERIRPLTWVEALYLVTEAATKGRHCTVTRYPVIEEGSCYPSRIHLLTTQPARTVTMQSLLTDGEEIYLPQYPVLGAAYCDSVVISSSKLAGLGADFDGDTVSVNYLWSDEANAEIHGYLHSPRAFVDTQQRLLAGGTTTQIALQMHNMTHW